MKPTFHIPPASPITSGHKVLLCDFSHQHMGLAIADGDTKQLLQLSYYELKNLLTPDTIDSIIVDEALDLKGFKRALVSSSIKEVVLVPADIFNEDNAKSFFKTTFGDTTETILFDAIAEQNLVLVHAVPQGVMGNLKSLIDTEIKHSYSYQLKQYNGFVAQDQIAVHFAGNEFTVFAKGGEQLKLVQTYQYTAPLDVVYYLLVICKEYGLLQEETTIILSGMISEDSFLYKELYQYFSSLHFWKPTTKAVLPSDYPFHFFSSLYNLAACEL
ncbi:MAG TPA: DUF3822 family protein [Chitinophagaceae bacterium]|nr:DUF3822 family protein [Chitinophagaceae bacterium]